ncbi:MAG: ribosome small subunit-dependent GTPase A [Chloroflexi bacterium]|nr:ribosome small subunit-dependent GTPase A [Chloroflexota bacterium]
MNAVPPALATFGWSEALAVAFQPHADAGHQPGRVVVEERGVVHVATADGETVATLAGRLRHEADLDPEVRLPAVGDWVAVAGHPADGPVVHAVLPRASAIVRRAPSDHARPTQVLAANVDVAFLVMSLNRDFNLRRLERYLAVAWESGATPVVLLSKADLVDDLDGMRLAAEATAPGTEVVAVSAVSGEGLDAVRRHLGPGRTVVFLGSSGVGKSSLVNALAGEPLLVTAAIREDDARGRHTTTRRQLVRLGDGICIDTPGLRELALVDGDGLAETFDDLEAVARTCRFGDCRHDGEPGCAVRAAIGEGRLSAERLAAYRKLEREARRTELAANPVARKAARRKWSAMIKNVERSMDLKYGRTDLPLDPW